MLGLNKNNFKEAIKKNKVMIVKYSAEWCGPCKMLTPIFEETSKEYKNITFAKVNVDLEPELAQEYGVRGIPCLIIFKDQKEVDRIVGFIDKETLRKRINKI